MKEGEDRNDQPEMEEQEGEKSTGEEAEASREEVEDKRSPARKEKKLLWEREGVTFFMVVTLFLLAIWSALGESSPQKSQSKGEKEAHQKVDKKVSLSEKLSQEEMAEKLQRKAQEHPVMALLLVGLRFLFPVVLSLIFWIYFFLLWSDERPFFSKKTETSPKWNLLDVFRIILFFFFIQVLLAKGSRFFIDPQERSTLFNLLVGNLSQLLTLVFALVVIYRWSGSKLRDMGLHFKKFKPVSLQGAMTYFMVYPLIIGALFLSFYIANRFHLRIQQNPVVDYMQQGGPFQVAFLAFMACILAPLYEEFFFRGLLYPALRRLSRPWVAMVASSVFFAVLHPGIHAFSIFILGMLLAYLYEKTGSLWPCLIVHSLNNTLAVAQFFIMQYMMG